MTLDITYAADKGKDGMKPALDRLCERAEQAVGDGYNIIILSDRLCSMDRIPIPSLLATSAVHHHLIRKGLRTSVGLVSSRPAKRARSTSSARSRATARKRSTPISPSRPWKILLPQLDEDLTTKEVFKRYIKALNKGILKVMSKMGISTYQSYCGAQIFDAVGLSDFVEQYFFGTNTQVEGVGLDEIAEETVRRHRDAFGDAPIYRNALDVGGEYAYRIRGERHMWSPTSVADLQHAVRGNSQDATAPCRPDQRAVGTAHDHARHVQDPRRRRHGPQPRPAR